MTPSPETGPDEPGFGLYLHWPFCLAKCPYCDFNSHVRHDRVDQPRFVRAFRKSLAHQSALAPKRLVTSVFFGGGTPSLMSPQTVESLISAIHNSFQLSANAEISMEANPTSVEASRLADYRKAGVNRLSIGVQALNDPDLKALGRRHTVDEAIAAIKLAQRSFDRTSFDLIYARPNQTTEGWRAELMHAIDLAAEHLSLYQLTIEPGTIYEQRVRVGQLKPLDDEKARQLYDVTQEICTARGLPAYEISNHARIGAQSIHNLTYWRYGEYAGIGPGAHARLVINGTRTALIQERHPETWLERVEQCGDATVENETLSAAQQGHEMVLMGLRLSEGISPARYSMLAGYSLDDKKIDWLVQENLLEWLGPLGDNDRRLRATHTARPVLNAVIEALLP
jgi:putative oxygen-independent coproporphyrinogen III oxidase